MIRNVGFLHAVPQTVTDNTYTLLWWEITTSLQARTGGFHQLDAAPTSAFTFVISLACEVTSERLLLLTFSCWRSRMSKRFLMGFYRTHWLSLSHHLTDERRILTLLFQYSSQSVANPASLVAMPTQGRGEWCIWFPLLVCVDTVHMHHHILKSSKTPW